MNWTKQEIELVKNSEGKLPDLPNKSKNAVRIMASRLGRGTWTRRKEVNLIYDEEQVVLGSLLGDGHCRIKGDCKNVILEEGHGPQQKEYLEWKINLLKKLDFSLRKMKNGCFFSESKAYPCLNIFHKLFYNTGKKRPSSEILQRIDRLGLAVWFMDDGSFSKRDHVAYLCTNGFTYEENMLIKNWFKTKWNIDTKIYSAKDPKNYPGKVWFYLHFSVEATKKLVNLIKEYIHPSMQYKIGVIN